MSEKSLNGHRNAKHGCHFQCETCKKSFENPSKLKRHEMIHEKSNSYTCDVCGKSFGRKDNMFQHKKRSITNSKSTR